MPNLITAARLAEIKARVEMRIFEIESSIFGRTATLEFVDHASVDVPDLVAALERAVDLLRACDEMMYEENTHKVEGLGKFLKEFGHDK
jgi:hypothetical protein